MFNMRITVTIDDDLAIAIEELRTREGHSFGSALNHLLRIGMQAKAAPPKATRYRTPTMALGLKPGIDPSRLNSLGAEFETDEILGFGRLKNLS